MRRLALALALLALAGAAGCEKKATPPHVIPPNTSTAPAGPN